MSETTYTILKPDSLQVPAYSSKTRRTEVKTFNAQHKCVTKEIAKAVKKGKNFSYIEEDGKIEVRIW